MLHYQKNNAMLYFIKVDCHRVSLENNKITKTLNVKRHSSTFAFHTKITLQQVVF